MKVIYHPWHYTDPVVFYLFYISWHELSDILVCVWVNLWNCHYQLRSVPFHLNSGAITSSALILSLRTHYPGLLLYSSVSTISMERLYHYGGEGRSGGVPQVGKLKEQFALPCSFFFFFNQSYKVLPSNKMALRIIKMSLIKEKKSKRIKQKIQHWKEKRMEKWCIVNYNQNFNKMKLAYQNSWSKIKT